MSKSLTELYQTITGLMGTIIDAEAIAKMTEDARNRVLGNLMWHIPSNANPELVNEFKTRLGEELQGVTPVVPNADIDNDGDVDNDDVAAIKETLVDANGDGELTDEDVEFVKSLSTAEIVVDDEDEDDVEVENE